MTDTTKPRCPKCGNTVTSRGQARGKPRWSHVGKELEACKWHGTEPVWPARDPGIDAKRADALHDRVVGNKRAVKRYVITCAQNATPIHRAFFESLKVYCKTNSAQLIVIPIRYKNPTSIDPDRGDDWWATELTPYLLDRRVDLNQNLMVLADIKTQPTATAPLGGLETISGDKSAIVGHPRLELVSVATPQNRLPKILTTTGAITQKNYIPSKAGAKGEHHHTFGAAAVEVDGNKFYLRQINAVTDGSFIDFDYEYNGAGRKTAPPAEALSLGDFHYPYHDPQVAEATFGPKGIVEVLKPKVLVWHDAMDFYSRNHHHRGEVFVNFAKHHAGKDNVEQEVKGCFAEIDSRTARFGVLNVFAGSNHPDALARWVKETDPRNDPENAVFWAKTFSAMCESARMTESGARTIDPFAFWGQKFMTTKAMFLKRGQSFMVKGIELGYHGDRGPNGARGSLKGFTKVGVKTVSGHRHSAGIEGGAYCNGTNSLLSLEYNAGSPSSWLHADTIVYANGKRSLIFVIDGKCRP